MTTETGAALQIQEGKAIAQNMQIGANFSFAPTNFEELWKYAQVVAKSEMVPKDFRGKPENIIVAIQYGSELGLKPLQAMQGIAIINGRPLIWGDHSLAIVQNSGLLEYIDETDNGSVATCRLKRKGQPNEVVRTFSMEDAKTAGLASRDGPWKTYPKRMRQMRARAFALRDTFADVLKGFGMREEFEGVEPEQASTSPELIMPRKISVSNTSHFENMDRFNIDPNSEVEAPVASKQISQNQSDQIRQSLVKFHRQATAFNEFLSKECGVEKIDDVLTSDFQKVMAWIETD